MTKGRLEAFSDGVIAILITIMVLELKTPEAPTVEALFALRHTFPAYVLSFVFLGIYWNNHHHMLHAVERVTGGVLWANLHLLFWLSLVPWATEWTGETPWASLPTAAYGVVLLGAAIAYFVLERRLIAVERGGSRLEKAVGRDVKGKVSSLLYSLAIPLAFVRPWIADAIYVAVAAWWFVPDARIERSAVTR